MAAHLQQLAEALADRLGRSIAIDDSRIRLLAHSPHHGEVDPARAESILRRAVPKEIVDHVYSCRDSETGLYLVGPRADLGLLDSSVGCPILHRGSLLGFVWLLGAEGPVDDQQLEAVRRAAASAAVLLHREHLSAASSRDRERELVEQLLGDRLDDRASAAAILRTEGIFAAGAYSILTAGIEQSGHATEEDQLALASGLAAVRSRRLPHDLLALERPGSVTLVVADAVADVSRESLLALADALRDAILATADGRTCLVGISRSRGDLADAWRGAEEADRAMRLARRVTASAPIVAVEDLGVYELLDQVPDDALHTMIHPGLTALLQQGSRNEPLVQTLEVFLDNAGDVKLASEQLYAHRTSLYYRLRRIQELTGLDLANGEDRLIAHVGLRIARLTGLWEQRD